MNFLIEPPEILQGERRKPASLPKLTLQNIKTSKYMDGFEDYVADNFVFRESLRTVHSATVFNLFLQRDNSGLYYDEVVGAGQFERLSKEDIRQVARKIKKISDDLDGLNIYYSYIPDKDIYSNIDYPGFDKDIVFETLSDELSEFTFIDLSDILMAEDFYLTDFHWDQMRLGNVVDKLGTTMGFDLDLDSFTSVKAGNFQGAYAGQLALTIDNDKMTYLVLDDPVYVEYLNDKSLEWEYGDIYDTEAFNGLDPYDIFLRGVEPLVVIENPKATSRRELYLFRDSFSSSLAPLLAQTYEKITLIDLRYINYSYISDFISFEKGSDVIFLYSSLVLNNPWDLLVK